MKLAINGVRYKIDKVGEGPAMLLLHGFSGTHQQWHRFYKSWSEHATLISVDLIGHGETEAPADAGRYEMKRTIEDLVAILDVLSIDKVTVLGYSMGGRIAISMAMLAPRRVERLILESTSPGLATLAEREQRVIADEQLADRIEANGIEWFAEYWGKLPLFASLEKLPLDEQLMLDQQRKCHTAHGLANSLRGIGTGAQPSWWDQMHQLHVPVILIVGEQDEKFKKIANLMISRMGQTDIQLEVVPFAGHNVHLEQAKSFDTIVLQCLLSKKG